jgi:tRNA modification GTPase
MASNGEIIISNKRHQYLIKNAAKEIVGAQEALKNNMPVELISSNLRNAMEELGKITGETVTDDVIKQIFSKFCLGK